NDGISLPIRNLHPHHLDKFISLMTHGRNFLEQSECEAFIHSFKRDYFRILARGLFYPRGWAQFQYHRNGLKTIRYDLTLLKLSPHILYELIALALNPMNTAEELGKAIKKALRYLGITAK